MESEENKHLGVSTSGDQIRPWFRFWARAIDIELNAFLFYLLISFFGLEINFDNPKLVFGYAIIFVTGYVFVEPLFLTIFGTTLGKSILNINLQKIDGSKLTYYDTLVRSTRVFYIGQGLGIPLINFITNFFAYRRLINKSKTSWDEEGSFQVTHQLIGIPRIALFIFIYLFLYLIRNTDFFFSNNSFE